MKNLFKMSVIGIIAMLIVVGCKSETKADSDSVIIPLEKFEEMAQNFVGQTVKTVGIADHVCKHGGKKLLLVSDDYSIHVMSDERFDDSIVGLEIEITGTLVEDRTDESTFQQWEDNANSIEEHDIQQNWFDYIKTMRDSLEKSGKDYFSEYSVNYISHKIIE
ncbi:MAG: hypothetical protein ISR90_06600 [Candidatus Marinimicrobia bacterium]|nr:hypothetical protein [Candidatus Neomarinimicrobiota bacterium]MBL7023701.1 hypothetical protein [Candidatus Neomarinimicrobiota bacterium]MBL7110007.1 hypothetical protein [Candidatus Neomarinimicrobiota bacterium]